jgi:hypothetical protein
MEHLLAPPAQPADRQNSGACGPAEMADLANEADADLGGTEPGDNFADPLNVARVVFCRNAQQAPALRLVLDEVNQLGDVFVLGLVGNFVEELLVRDRTGVEV